MLFDINNNQQLSTFDINLSCAIKHKNSLITAETSGIISMFKLDDFNHEEEIFHLNNKEVIKILKLFNGEFLIVGTDTSIHIFSLNSDTLIGNHHLNDPLIEIFAFNNKYLTIVTKKSILILNFRSGEIISEENYFKDISSACLVNKNLIAIASEKYVYIYDIIKMEYVKYVSIKSSYTPINVIYLISDNIIALGGNNNFLSIWNIENRKKEYELKPEDNQSFISILRVDSDSLIAASNESVYLIN